MLNGLQVVRMAAASGLLVVMVGCERTAPPAARLAPITVEASYRLLFNDALVGNSLFMLEIDADGRYALQSFTTPAGKMQRDAAHEVLETSRGSIGADGVRPLEFEESVLQDGELALARLTFDWARRALVVEGPGGRRNIGLLPDTQDRLSYLLDAARLAGTGDDSRLLQVASAEAAEETLLRVRGEESLTLPAGEFGAVRVERRTPDEDTSRELWFAPDLMPLPLRALQASDGNSVEMQLEHLSQRPNDPR
ncbi:MAG: DUF3108 domain-containing protein [Gammaproteobacteria bacterium]|nr:DUF3108 domain-containing protein [Gammaproteobacteria bacterium]